MTVVEVMVAAAVTGKKVMVNVEVTVVEVMKAVAVRAMEMMVNV